MPRYVAFLGGINVGGHRVKMERLAALFTELGHTDVSTFIASGNVLFTSKRTSPERIEAELEQHLESELGYAVPAFVRTEAEIAAIMSFDAYPGQAFDPEHDRMHVCFFRRSFTEAEAGEVQSLQTPVDRLLPHAQEVYWWCNGPVTDSRVKWRQVAKRFGSSTARNVTMLRKLLPLLQPKRVR